MYVSTIIHQLFMIEITRFRRCRVSYINAFPWEGIDLEYHLKVVWACDVLASHCIIWFIAYDRETKSGLSCLHKLNFSGLFLAFKDVASWCPRHIQDSRLAWLLWVLLGYLIWHLLKLLKIESLGTSFLQKEYTKVIKSYTGVQGWTTLS